MQPQAPAAAVRVAMCLPVPAALKTSCARLRCIARSTTAVLSVAVCSCSHIPLCCGLLKYLLLLSCGMHAPHATPVCCAAADEGCGAAPEAVGRGRPPLDQGQRRRCCAQLGRQGQGRQGLSWCCCSCWSWSCWSWCWSWPFHVIMLCSPVPTAVCAAAAVAAGACAAAATCAADGLSGAFTAAVCAPVVCSRQLQWTHAVLVSVTGVVVVMVGGCVCVRGGGAVWAA